MTASSWFFKVRSTKYCLGGRRRKYAEYDDLCTNANASPVTAGFVAWQVLTMDTGAVHALQDMDKSIPSSWDT